MSVAISSARGTTTAAAAAASPMITLRDVTLRRGANEVLRNLSLDITAGQVTAIVGRSGVGKTTLICALNGLLPPAAGTISVAGLGALDNHEALQAHRCRTATVFQEHALIDRLPAIENVLLGFADMRHPLSPLPWSSEMTRRAAEVLRDVGLMHRATTRVAQLSGGERQRVGIARALVRRPRLLLADEPFASVDRTLVRQLSEEFLGAVMGSGATLVIVLHQIDTALALSDTIVGLTPGGVAYDGPASGFDAAAQASVFGA